MAVGDEIGSVITVVIGSIFELRSDTTFTFLSSIGSPQIPASGDCPYLLKHSIYGAVVGEAVGEAAKVGAVVGVGVLVEVGEGVSEGSGVMFPWRIAVGVHPKTAAARIAVAAAPNTPSLNRRCI